jgi:hypothetical protein
MVSRNWFSLRHQSGKRSRSKDQQRRRLRLEQLEVRELMTADLLSAYGMGNGEGTSRAEDLATDAAGNSYLTGSFSGTVDFDPAHEQGGNVDVLTSAGGTDIFVAKYAPDSTLLWVVRMGGTTHNTDPENSTPGPTDGGRGLAVDGVGNVYVTGEFHGTGDFGAINLTAGSDRDGFAAKLDSAGNVTWAKSWGQTGGSYDHECGYAIDTDNLGNAYVVGIRNADGNGGSVSHEIRKFSSTGSLAWEKSLQTHAPVMGSDLIADGSGNVFIAGTFAGSVDFDPGSAVKSAPVPWSYNAFVLKLTSSGNFKWVAPFNHQGQSSSYAGSLTMDGSGNVIVAGSFNGTVDFNPSSRTSYLTTNRGGFVTKLNGNGGLVWAKALQGGYVNVKGLATDSAGNIYATGNFSGPTDFDPGSGVANRESNGQEDIFVLKLSSSGTLQWVETFGGTGTDIGFGIAVDPVGTIHFAGEFRDSVDFDPDPVDTYLLTNPGEYRNIFFAKLGQV